MRIIACAILFCNALPTFAQQTHQHDFRGGKFDGDILRFYGQTPDKFFTPEEEGLRLTYPGNGAPPANFTAGVVWRFHARGDFVVIARYEILKVDRPKKGSGVGPELYLRVKNAGQGGIALARVVPPKDGPDVRFTYLINNERGGRDIKASKQANTNDGTLRGAFRLVRVGPLLTASFAEGDGGFEELHRAEIGTDDIDMIRFAGLAGGDPSAVLDMRMLEFSLTGKALGLDGRDFAEAAPNAEVPAAADPAPAAAKSNLLLLAAIFLMLAVPLFVIGAIVLFLHLRQSNNVAQARSSAIAKDQKPGPAPRSERTT